jgi:uncharacterized delta-60 repeat protein
MTSYGKFRGLLVLFLSLVSVFFAVAGPPEAQAQDVVVSQAVPDNADQGTVYLNVTIKGKGFKKGAIAKWLVTGSEADTGGVTVNSTAFVSSSELRANITVAPNAQTEKKLDIKVTLTSGRTGKGIELFSVLRKETTACTAPISILAAPWSCFLQGAAGCLDTAFGNNGLVITNTSGSAPTVTDFDIASDAATQADGKLIVVGASWYEGAGKTVFTLVRYNPDGTLDTTFGGTGIAKFLHPNAPDPGAGAGAVAIQPDGKIVVAGDYSMVARSNPDGTLDTSFGSGGLTLITFPSGRKGKPGREPGYASFRDVAIQSDGKIVLVGYAGNSWIIVRLNSDGSLDSSFGDGGKLAPPEGNNNGRAAAVALQPVQVGETIEERILVGGYLSGLTGPNDDGDFAVMRFTPSGGLDATFGPSGAGMVVTDFCGDTESGAGVSGLALDPAGNIVAGGNAQFEGFYNFAIARYSRDGILDTSFGDPDSGTNQPGRTWASLMGPAADWFGGGLAGQGLLLQPDGKGIVTGTATDASGALYFGLVRFNADGTLDTTFGTGGAVVTDFGIGDEWGLKGAIQDDGKIAVVGTVDTNGTGYNFAVARYWH